MNIGTKIKTARKVAGLTQKELGEKLGVSAAMIAQYETGRRFPKMETVQKLSKALDVDINYLYTASDERRLELLECLEKTEAKFRQDEEYNLIREFRRLNQKGRTKVLSYSRDLGNNPEYVAYIQSPATETPAPSDQEE